MDPILIARRFRGPPESANGGYFAGAVAQRAGRTVTVRLRRPPPLDTPLTLHEGGSGQLQVRHGETLVGECEPATLSLIPPLHPRYLEAVEASREYAGFRYHRFPGCFVCGTERVRGDGMRVFAGPMPELGVVAAPWVPDTSLDRGDGKVQAEFMSAALDCPGYYAVAADDRMLLLAEYTVHVDRLVHVGEACTVVGWAISGSGRKREAGTALYDGKGELCGRARALWIEPRPRAAD